MDKQLTLGSLFDGSGGFPLGGLLSGIAPLWASEIEPFPIRVTTKRLPFMKHYGDVSALSGAELEPVDILTFGSPCQDMSIAGKRAGLDGSRSNLFYEAVRIAKEMRSATNGKYPSYLVWENVPGAFSSNDGEDFKAVLDEIRRIKEPEADTPRPAKWPNAGYIVADDYSIAWRVLDAQYWGVPQRRKRIYLVADLAGQRAGKVLFESEGLSGYTPQGFRSWQGFAGASEAGAGTAGTVCLNDQGGQRVDVTEDVTSTLRAEAHHPPVVAAGFCTEHSAKARSIGYEEELAPTLRAGTVPAAVAVENHPADGRVTVSEDGKVQTLTSRMGTGGNNVPLVAEAAVFSDKAATLSAADGPKGPSSQQFCNPEENFVCQPVAYGICSKHSNAMLSDNPKSGFYKADTTRTLDGNGGNPSCNQGGMAVVALEGNGARPSHNGPGFSEENVSFTLNATEHHAVAAPVYSATVGSYMTVSEEKAQTLMARDFKDPQVVNAPYYIVRRLTPTECARLQGFPDWWCSGLGTDNPTEEELVFWREVFETHRKITGGAAKPKTGAQIRKWLKDPHSDAAEYKLWGNGVALPCVHFVLAGIVWCEQNLR